MLRNYVDTCTQRMEESQAKVKTEGHRDLDMDVSGTIDQGNEVACDKETEAGSESATSMESWK